MIENFYQSKNFSIIKSLVCPLLEMLGLSSIAIPYNTYKNNMDYRDIKMEGTAWLNKGKLNLVQSFMV